MFFKILTYFCVTSTGAELSKMHQNIASITRQLKRMESMKNALKTVLQQEYKKQDQTRINMLQKCAISSKMHIFDAKKD
jgi:hypothetical protein